MVAVSLVHVLVRGTQEVGAAAGQFLVGEGAVVAAEGVVVDAVGGEVGGCSGSTWLGCRPILKIREILDLHLCQNLEKFDLVTQNLG